MGLPRDRVKVIFFLLYLILLICIWSDDVQKNLLLQFEKALERSEEYLLC